MTGIEFCDPPFNPKAKGNSKWHEVVLALRERPGEWAKIATRGTKESARNFASEIRRGSGNFRPAGAFEAVARDGQVWARYVGGSK